MAEVAEKITEETEVSPAELAAVLRLSGRRVRQLTEDGVLRKNGAGRYALIENVQLWHLNATAQPVDEEDLKLEKTRRKSEVQIKASKAMIAKLEAEELKGLMHRAEDVAAMTEDMVYTFRGALMALPGRLAVDVCGCDTPAEASDVIRREVYKVMQELAAYHYDPKKYEERVRARKDWAERDGDDE